MAKKTKSDDLDLDLDFDFEGDDFNFDDEFTTESKNSKSRSPVSDVFTGTISGVKNKIAEPEFIGKAVKDSLPKNYQSTFETVDKISRDTREVYDEAVKEIKPHVKGIASNINRLVPDNLTLIKRLTDKVDKYFNDEPQFADNRASIEDQLVSNTISEVFSKKEEVEQNQRAEDKAEKFINSQIDSKRFSITSGTMGRIANSIDKIVGMKEGVELNYQKKSLELQIRSLFTLQNLTDKTIKFQEVASRQNESLVKNTALPEFVKLQESERFKEIARNKLYDGIQNSIAGLTGLDGGLAKIKKDGKEFFKGVKDGAAMGNDMLSMLREQLDSIDELNAGNGGFNISKSEMMGNMLGGGAANMMRDFITDAIRTVTSEDQRIMKTGNKLSAMIDNPGAFAKEFENSDMFYELMAKEGISGKLAQGLEYIFSNFKDNNSLSLGLGNSGTVKELGAPGVITNRFIRSVEEVIPSWLASIHQELVFGNKDIEGARPDKGRFDFRTSAIVSKDSAKEKSTKDIEKAADNSMFRWNVSNMSNTLLDGAEVDPEIRKGVDKFLIKVSREKNVRMDRDGLMSTKAFRELDDATKLVILQATEGLDRENETADKYAKEAALSKNLRNVRDSVSDFRGTINEARLNNNLDVLIEEGLVKQSENGELVIDEDKYMEYLEKGYFAKSDKNKKENIKPVTKKKGNSKFRSRFGRYIKSDVETKESIAPASTQSALDKIRATDVHTWNYKEGEGDSEDHIGPMAQDVQKNMGNSTAPDGKKIDLVNMNGILMAGVQELADRVDTLASQGEGQIPYLQSISSNTEKMASLLESKAFMKFELNDEFIQKFSTAMSDKLGTAIDNLKSKSEGIAGKIKDQAVKGVKGGLNAGKYSAQKLYAASKGTVNWTKDVIFNPALDYINDPETKKAITEGIGGAFKATMSLGRSVMSQVNKTITERIPKGFEFVKDKLKSLTEVLYDGIIGPVDVYIKGKLEPALQATLMRAGEYKDSITGKVIRSVRDLEEAKGNIVNKAGEVVMTISQMSEGMYDGLGKRIQSKAVTAMQVSAHIGGKLIGGAYKAAKKIGTKIGDALGITDGRMSELADRLSESMRDTFGDGFGFGISKEADTAIIDVRDLLYRVYPEEAESVEASKQVLRGDPARRGKGLIKSIKDFLRRKDKDATPDEGGTDFIPEQETSQQQPASIAPVQAPAPVRSESSGGGFFSNFFNNTKNRLKQGYAEYNRKKLDPSGDRGRTNLKVNDPESETVEIIDSLNKYGPEDLGKPEVKSLLERAKALNPKEFIEAAKKYYSPEKIKEVQDKLSGNKVTKEVKELAEAGISILKGGDKANPTNPIETIKGILNKGISSVKGSGFKPEENKALTELLQKVGAGNLDISSLLDKAGNLKDGAVKTLQGLITDDVKGTGREGLVNKGVNFLNTGFDKIKNLFGYGKDSKPIAPQEIAGPKFKGNKFFEWIKGKYDPEKVRGFRDRMEGIPLVGESLAARFDSGLLGKELNQDRTTLGQKLSSMKSKVGNFFSGKGSQESEAREANTLDIIEKYKTLPNSTLGKFLNSSPGKRFLKTVSSTPPDKVNDVARKFLGGFKDKRYLEAFERGKENVEKEWRGEPVEDESLMDRIKAGAGKAGKLLGDTKIGKGAKFLGKEFGMIGRSAAEIGGHIGKAGLNAIGVNPDALKDQVGKFKDNTVDVLHSLGLKANEKIKDPLKELGRSIASGMSEKYAEVKDKASVGLNMAKEDIAKKGRAIYNQALIGGAMVGDKYDEVKQKVYDKYGKQIDAVKETISPYAQAAAAKYNKVKGFFTRGKSEGSEGLSLKDRMRLHVAHIGDRVSDKISPYADKVKETYGKTKDVITDKIDDVKQSAKDLGKEFLDNSPETRKLIEHWTPRAKKAKEFGSDVVAEMTKKLGITIAKDKVMDVKDRLLDKFGKKAKDTPLADVVEEVAHDVANPDTLQSTKEEYAPKRKGGIFGGMLGRAKTALGFGKEPEQQVPSQQNQPKYQNQDQAQQTQQSQQEATDPSRRGLLGTLYDKSFGRSKFGRRMGNKIENVAGAIGGSKTFQGISSLAGGMLKGLFGATGTDDGSNNNANIQQGAQMADYEVKLSNDASKGPSFNDKDGDGRRAGSWEDKYAKMELEKRERLKRKELARPDTKYKSNENIIDKMMGAAKGIVDNVASIGAGLMEAAGGLFGGGDDGRGRPNKPDKTGRTKGGAGKGRGKWERIKGIFGKGTDAKAGTAAGKAAEAAKAAGGKPGMLSKLLPSSSVVRGVAGVGTAMAVGSAAMDIYASETSDKTRDEKDLETSTAVGDLGGSLAGGLAGAKVGAAAGMLLGPVGAAVGGVVGGGVGAIAGSKIGSSIGGWFGKKLTSVRKYFSDESASEYDMVRIYQYGLGHTEGSKEHINKIFRLEQYLEDGRTGYEDGQAYLIEKKMSNEELFSLMDIDPNDQVAVTKFTTWFLERFKPVYLHQTSLVFSIDKKTRLGKVNMLTKKQKKEYLEKANLESTPYQVKISPFNGVDYLNVSAEYSSNLTKKLLKLEENEKDKGKLAPPMVPTTVDANKLAEGELKDETKRRELEAKQVQTDNLAAASSNNAFAPPAASSTGTAGASAGSSNEETGGGVQEGHNGEPESLGKASATENKGQEQSDLGGRPPGNIAIAPGDLKDGSEGLKYVRFYKPDVRIDTMNPTMKRQLLGMIQEYGETTGKKVIITSGTRTTAEQARLHAKDPKKAAAPGTSLHEFGVAVDINTPDVNAMDKLGLMRKYGFTRPVGGETWHVEPAGIQGRLQLAKKDPNAASTMVAQGAGFGGGGIGSVRGSRKYRRDPNATKQLMEATSKVVLPKAEAEKAGQALPEMGPAPQTPADTTVPVAAGQPTNKIDTSSIPSSTPIQTSEASTSGASTPSANTTGSSAPAAETMGPPAPTNKVEAPAETTQTSVHSEGEKAPAVASTPNETPKNLATMQLASDPVNSMPGMLKVSAKSTNDEIDTAFARNFDLSKMSPEDAAIAKRGLEQFKKFKENGQSTGAAPGTPATPTVTTPAMTLAPTQATSGNTNTGSVATPTSTAVDNVPEPAMNFPVANTGGKYSQVKQIINQGAAKVGMDPTMMQAFAAIESSMNPNAAAKTSSAKGLYQFLRKTWAEQVGKHARKHNISPGVSPLDPYASTVLAGEYLKANLRTIKGIKPDLNIVDAYLTHFLGPGGAHRFLKAGMNADAVKTMPRAAAANKSIFYNKDGSHKTIGQVYNDFKVKIAKKAAAFGVSPNLSGSGPVESSSSSAGTGNDSQAAQTSSFAANDTGAQGQGPAQQSAPMSTGAMPVNRAATNPNFSMATDAMSGAMSSAMPTSPSLAPAPAGMMKTSYSDIGTSSDSSGTQKPTFERIDPLSQGAPVDGSFDPSRHAANTESQLGMLVDINREQLTTTKALLDFIKAELPKLTAGREEIEEKPVKERPELKEHPTRGSSASPSSSRREMPAPEINLGRRST